MSSIRVPGHKLETISTRGGIYASCSCEASTYRNPNTKTGIWMTWERDRICAAHQAHLHETRGENIVIPTCEGGISVIESHL